MNSHILFLATAGLLTSAHAHSGDSSNTLGASDSAASPWEITGAANFGLTDGNSETLSIALQLLAQYSKGKNEATIGADWLYSENTGVAKADSFRLHGKYNRLMTDRSYFSMKGSYLTDHIADIDYRFDLSVGLGYSLIKNDITTLSLVAGPGITWENQGGISNQDLAVSFGQTFSHQFNGRTRLLQNLVITPVASDFGDYLLTAEAGIDTVLSEYWAVRTSFRYRYDSTPATGSQPDDTALLLGLSYSLGGFETDGTRSIGSIGSGWDHSAAAGFSHIGGNSDSSATTLSADSALRTDAEEIFLKASYRFSHNDGSNNADVLRANGQYNRLTSENSYFGANASFLRDDLANVNYRVTPAMISGHYFIKNDEMTLSFEGGPSFTFEDVGGLRDDYFSIVIAEKFNWAINEHTTFKQALNATFNPSETNNFTLVADAALDILLTEKVSWRFGASWSYDNQPAAGRKSDDTVLSSGLSITF